MVGLNYFTFDPEKANSVREKLESRGIGALCSHEIAFRYVLVDGKLAFLKINPSKKSSKKELWALELVDDHPNIPSLIEYFEHNGLNFFLLEPARGTQLGELTTEEDIARGLEGALEAVRHCHSKGIVHNDPHDENIIVGRDVYLIDFDDSAPLTRDRQRNECSILAEAAVNAFTELLSKRRLPGFAPELRRDLEKWVLEEHTPTGRSFGAQMRTYCSLMTQHVKQFEGMTFIGDRSDFEYLEISSEGNTSCEDWNDYERGYL